MHCHPSEPRTIKIHHHHHARPDVCSRAAPTVGGQVVSAGAAKWPTSLKFKFVFQSLKHRNSGIGYWQQLNSQNEWNLKIPKNRNTILRGRWKPCYVAGRSHLGSTCGSEIRDSHHHQRHASSWETLRLHTLVFEMRDTQVLAVARSETLTIIRFCWVTTVYT